MALYIRRRRGGHVPWRRGILARSLWQIRFLPHPRIVCFVFCVLLVALCTVGCVTGTQQAAGLVCVHTYGYVQGL